MDKFAAQFSTLIADALAESKQKRKVSDELVSALLEDPVRQLENQELSRCREANRDPARYKAVRISWESSPNFICSADIRHEVSQELVHRLSSDRLCCYRLHRFTLPTTDGWSALVKTALDLAEQGGGIEVSNVGGFHSELDFFEPDDLLQRIATCVRQAAISDAESVKNAGEVAPDWPTCSFAGSSWANVSYSGALNALHNHGDAVSAVFYAQAPEESDGSLLLRLTPGIGNVFAGPDEKRHVPFMWSASASTENKRRKLMHPDQDEVPRCGEQTDSIPGRIKKSGVEASCPECTNDDGVVRYVEVRPEPGLLIVFPGWIPHSVLPHFSDKPRISFASNWYLPCSEDGNES